MMGLFGVFLAAGYATSGCDGMLRDDCPEPPVTLCDAAANCVADGFGIAFCASDYGLTEIQNLAATDECAALEALVVCIAEGPETDTTA